MKKYSTVLFDMDGVIVDSMQWHAESWQRVFRENNIELPKMEIFLREGMSGLASIIDILKSNDKPVPDENALKSYLNRKLEIFETREIGIYPYAMDILDIVKDRKLNTGLVTGSLKRTVRYILSDNQLSCFDVIISVDDIIHGKPHPEPYLKAMKKLEANPDEVLVIENAPLGIISAKQAGADCFALGTTLGKEHLKEADKIFKNHRDLLEYLKNNL